MGEKVTPALNDAADRAQVVARQASDYTKEQADAVAEQVRGRPLVAIAIAGRCRIRARPLRPLSTMRTVELGRTAAQAELLRMKRFIRRQAMRGVWGAVAAVFAIAVLVMVHVVAYHGAGTPLLTPIWAAVVVLGFDLVDAGDLWPHGR